MKRQRIRLQLEILEDRCTPATFGNPWPDAGHLTLSFVPDGTQVGHSRSNLFQTLNALAPTRTWQMEILRAFQTWAAAANIDIAVVPDRGLPLGSTGAIQGDSRFGDIRIAAYPMAQTAEAFAAPFEVDAGTWSGDVQLNSAANFSINGQGYDLYTVMLHEAGHVLGLEDNSDPASVMDASYLGTRSGLGAADVAAVQGLYGARSLGLNNNQLSAATPLIQQTNASGALGMTVNGAIATLQDHDFYSFVTPRNKSALDVVLNTGDISLLTPRVSVYDASGHIVVSTVASDPFAGGFVVHLKNVQPLTTYYVEVASAQQNVFGVGGYQLTIQHNGSGSHGGRVTATITRGAAGTTTFLSNNHVDNDSFAGALPLTSEFVGANGGATYAFRGHLDDASDAAFFAVQAPASGSANVLSAMVWGLETNGLDSRLAVFDAEQNPVAAQVLVNDHCTYTIQVPNAFPGATYVIEVFPANPTGSHHVGKYFLGVNFSTNAVDLQDFVADTVAAGALSQAVLTLTQSQMFHFVLTSTPSDPALATASVQMTIIDSQGQIAYTLTGGSNEPISGNAILQPDTYQVVFVAAGGSQSFLLRGRTLTDPIGPQPTDPNGPPPGGPGSGGYTWSGGSGSGVPSQPPASNPITLTLIPNRTNNAGDSVTNVQVVSSISDTISGATFTYSAMGLPSGLSIDPATGLISGTIASNADTQVPGGVYSCAVMVTDSANNRMGKNFTWTVNPVVRMIVLGAQSNVVGTTIATPVQVVSATDADGNALIYTATGLPDGLSMDSTTGLVAGTITGATGNYLVTVTATDSTNSAFRTTLAFPWMVYGNPVSVQNPGTQVSYDGQTLSMQVNAFNLVNGVALTYYAVGLPAGLSIDPATGLISGTIADHADADVAGGVYSSEITVTDNAGHQAGTTFTWTVNPVVTVIASQGNLISSVSAALSSPVQLVYATNANSNTLTYSAVGLPDGLTIDPNTGLVSGTITAAPGAYSVTITAVDASNSDLSASTTIAWTISPIVVQNPGMQISYVGQTPSLHINAMDSTSSAVLTYSATGLPATFAIDPSTGAISGAIDDTTPCGLYTISVTVSDDGSNQISVRFLWLVSPAVTMTSLGSQSNQVGETLSNFVQVVSASDAFGNALVYTAAGLPDGLTMDQASGQVSGTITADAGSYSVTVTATDCSDSSFAATLVFTWIITT